MKGFANWMKVQAQEEMVHAVKFFNQINERGGALPALSLSKVSDKLMRIMLGGKLNEAASLPSAESLQ